MTISLESLARTIAKARHGTDAMWANYMGAAEAARREVVEECARLARAQIGNYPEVSPEYTVACESIEDDIRALIAQPDGAL